MNSKVFYFPQIPPRSPYYNLAIEEALSLQLVSQNLTAGVRLWKNPDSIILGLSENPFRNIKEEVVKRYETEARTKGFQKNQNLIFVILLGERREEELYFTPSQEISTIPSM